MCQDLVAVLRDDALHADRAWAVAETVLEALKGSFRIYLLYADDATESHFTALARQLANATMVRGPGFTVLEAIDAQAMVTLHVAAIQHVLQLRSESEAQAALAPVFFKGLAQLLGTLTPVDAIQVHSTLHQRLAAAEVEPASGQKVWDPYFSYEKRLLNLAAKDAAIVHRAGQPSHAS